MRDTEALEDTVKLLVYRAATGVLLVVVLGVAAWIGVTTVQSRDELAGLRTDIAVLKSALQHGTNSKLGKIETNMARAEDLGKLDARLRAVEADQVRLQQDVSRIMIRFMQQAPPGQQLQMISPQGRDRQ